MRPRPCAAHRNAYPYPSAYAHRRALAHRNAYPDHRPHAHRNPDSHHRAYAYRNPDSYHRAYAYADRHCDSYSRPYSHAGRNAYPDPHSAPNAYTVVRGNVSVGVVGQRSSFTFRCAYDRRRGSNRRFWNGDLL